MEELSQEVLAKGILELIELQAKYEESGEVVKADVVADEINRLQNKMADRYGIDPDGEPIVGWQPVK